MRATAGIAPVELIEEYRQHQNKFEHGWYCRQHDRADERLDGVAAPLKDSGEPASLPFKVKAQREAMQMGKDIACEPPHRVHCDGRKERIPRLREERHQNA